VSYAKISQALDTGVFAADLCEIATPPSSAEIDRAAVALAVKLRDDHLDLLRTWGGSDLHEIRIHGAAQLRVDDAGLIEFADDYSGSVFKYDPQDGAVYAIEAASGETLYLAASVAEFINEFLLGPKGEDFYGEDWVRELKARGLA